MMFDNKNKRRPRRRQQQRIILVTILILFVPLLSFVESVRDNNNNNDNNENNTNDNTISTTNSTTDLSSSSSHNNVNTKTNSNNNRYLLDENSVVLITGAAGFLGSELAMALIRTYNIKKLICIDRMDRGFGMKPTSTSTGEEKDEKEKSITTDEGDANDGEDAASKKTTTTKQRRHNEHELHLFEFKRQRLFRVLQTAGAKGHFYRIDFRPSIPEYFDSTEVPVLYHIFTKDHPDITHVVHFADHYHRTGMDSTEDMKYQQVVPRVRGGEKAGMMESILEQLRLLQSLNNGTKPLPHLVYASSADVYDIFRHKDNTEDVSTIPNPPPFKEHLPISTPSSIAGTSKLIDEMLAQTYYDIAGIKSIGLRFFTIYGPWGLPGSPVFEMAEAAIAGTIPLTSSIPTSTLDHIKDYCYIDDAIDAVMSAMQLEPPKRNPSLVFNVGSGEGISLRSIAKLMKELVPSNNEKAKLEDFAYREPPTVSIANLDRSTAVLGYEPRVPLKEGLELTLAWHYDRTYPYGTGAIAIADAPSDNNNEESHNKKAASKNDISQKGMVACLPYDDECLKGNIVFPCSSECSHPQKCIATLYDDVIQLSRAITSECSTVLYTVTLEPDLNDIPSIHVRVSSQSIAYIKDGGGYCNIAFVPENSPLYSRASATYKPLHQDEEKAGIIKYGFWTLVPVAIPDFTKGSSTFGDTTIFSIAHSREILEMIPKLSPTLFFGSKVEHAIYCDPDIIFDSIPRLLQEANMQPKQPNKDSPSTNGVTVMLIGKRSHTEHSTASAISPSFETMHQENAYRTVRMALIDEMMGDGFTQMVDSSFIVHNYLQYNDAKYSGDDDSKFFRCDILGEVLTWNVPVANAAIEFIMSLHDMWSRIMVEKLGTKPWWIGDDVTTIPTDNYYHYAKKKAQDLQIDFGDIVRNPESNNKKNKKVVVDPEELLNHRRLQAIEDDKESTTVLTKESHLQKIRNLVSSKFKDKKSETEKETGDSAEAEEGEESPVKGGEDEDDDTTPVEEEQAEKDKTTTSDEEHNGFGVVQEAIQAVFGGISTAGAGSGSTTTSDKKEQKKQKKVERFAQPIEGANTGQGDGTEIDDFVVNDDDASNPNNNANNNGAGGEDDDTSSGNTIHRKQPKFDELPKPGDQDQDPSSYDVWMGILSSSNTKYFSRIVSMEAVGVYRVEKADTTYSTF